MILYIYIIVVVSAGCGGGGDGVARHGADILRWSLTLTARLRSVPVCQVSVLELAGRSITGRCVTLLEVTSRRLSLCCSCKGRAQG